MIAGVKNTMKQEIISIVVLAYNTEKYIKKCLDSICKQTYQKLEIIVILDGCSDKTEKIVRKFAEKEKRIRILSHENKGTCFCRIEGYQNAKGKYIMYVDSDDWIEKNTIEVMYQNLLDYEVDLVHCQYKRQKEKEIKIPKNILNRNVKMNVEELEPQFFDLLYYTNNCNSICRQLISKEIMSDMPQVDSDLLYNEDLACNLTIYKKMKSILFIPDELYVYRKNPNGITKRMDTMLIQKKIKDMCQVHYELYDAISDFGIHDKKKYKQYACIKMLYQLTYLFYRLKKSNHFHKVEFISYMESIVNQAEIKEMIQYLHKNPNDIALKEMGPTTYQTSIYLMNEKYHALYYYYKLIYSIILFFERKFKK